MTARGTGKVSKRAAKSRSQRAGLFLPVSKVHKYLREGNFARHIGVTASVFMTAVIEYLCAEILELAAQAAVENNRTRISPRHIMMVIRKDDELNSLLRGVTIAGGGVVPNMRPELLPNKVLKNNSAAQVSSQEY